MALVLIAIGKVVDVDLIAYTISILMIDIDNMILHIITILTYNTNMGNNWVYYDLYLAMQYFQSCINKKSVLKMPKAVCYTHTQLIDTI